MDVERVNRLTNQLAAARARLGEFNTAKTQIEIAIEKLKFAIENFCTTLSELRLNYTQTGNPKYEARINELIRLSSERVTFFDTVLLDLNTQIRFLNSRISSLRSDIIRLSMPATGE